MSAPILYCVLAHAFPRQTLRLLRSIYNERDLFVIHIDRSAPREYIELLRSRAGSLPNVRVVSNHICSWGGFSLVAAEIDLLKEGFAFEGTPWTHAVFLSGTHLPVWPREKIRAWLVEDESCVDWFEFPQTKDCPEDGWGKAVWNRFNWYYEETPGEGMKKTERSPPLNFIYGVGSQWVALARVHADFAVRGEPDSIRDRMTKTSVADESYFQTILANSPYRDQRAPRKKTTHLVWEGKQSPKTFTLGEYIEYAQNATSPFMRKFPDDLGNEEEVNRILESCLARELPRAFA